MRFEKETHSRQAVDGCTFCALFPLCKGRREVMYEIPYKCPANELADCLEDKLMESNSLNGRRTTGKCARDIIDQ